MAMKRVMMKSVLAAFALATLPAFAQDRSDQPVAVNTDALQRLVARKVQEAAQRGMPALRRHLWATFHLHRVWLDDVMKPEQIAQYEGASKVALDTGAPTLEKVAAKAN
jgi:hypothetical protein